MKYTAGIMALEKSPITDPVKLPAFAKRNELDLN
jgi:hypothetical protein